MASSEGSVDGFIIAHSQLVGAQSDQEDTILQFNAECIAIADGVSAMPHGKVASTFVSDTAVWCYKHVRQRPYYWEDKSKLLKRIFKTSNLALWQKRKEAEFAGGLASTLSVIILGIKKFWIGTVGDSRSFLIREGLIEELIPPEDQSSIRIPMALGFERSGIVPRITSDVLLSGDVLILATDGVSDVITEEDLRLAYDVIGQTQESCMQAVLHILTQANDHGSRDNMSVCVIRKL